MRLFSECSLRGRTAAIAMAAEAPQIATAPPVKRAERQPRPRKSGAEKTEEDGPHHPADDQHDETRAETD
jgi:hypothetical protein